jgi:hypothetical protein
MGTGNAGQKLKVCPEHLGKLDAGKLKFSTGSTQARIERVKGASPVERASLPH